VSSRPIIRLNLTGILADLAVALACILFGDTLASRVFFERRIHVQNVLRKDLLIAGIGLLGVATVASAAPGIAEFVVKTIWFAQGSLQSQFRPLIERSWEQLSRGVLSLVVGLVLVTKTGRLGTMLDGRYESGSAS
jgi:hypothetical protein